MPAGIIKKIFVTGARTSETSEKTFGMLSIKAGGVTGLRTSATGGKTGVISKKTFGIAETALAVV